MTNMRFADLLGIALSALVQQKVRTLIAMMGVVIPTIALVLCISLGWGFEAEVMRQLNRGAMTRQIAVWPGSGVREETIPKEELEVTGPMSYAKRQRIRRAIVHRWPERGRGAQLTPERVRQIARLDHVRSVVPFIRQRVDVRMKGQLPRTVHSFAASADNLHFHNRLVAGDYFSSDSEEGVLVSEYLLYRWKITDDDAVDRVVGRKIRLTYRPQRPTPRVLLDLIDTHLDLPASQKEALKKAVRGLPGGTRPAVPAWTQAQLSALLAAGPGGPLPVVTALRLGREEPAVHSVELPIVGVIREFMEDKDSADVFEMGEGSRSRDADVFLPARTAEKLFVRTSPSPALGYPGVTVTVDSERNIKEVAHNIHRMGLSEYSLLEYVEGLRTYVVLMTFVTAFLAAIALLVAALGIINTMLMTVLERTHEIGVMKAVGACDRHIQMIFLVEGALIGLIGGGLGLFLGWVLSLPGDSVVRWLLQDKALPTLKHSLFVFPWWLTLGAPTFAGLVTTLAAVYPAHRATRINPITALRHE
jgi:putative ABC transport system permease protein